MHPSQFLKQFVLWEKSYQGGEQLAVRFNVVHSEKTIKLARQLRTRRML